MLVCDQASSLADAMVGGSRECVAAVRAGFADVGDRISTAAGRRELEKDFNVCNASSSSPILEDVRSQAVRCCVVICDDRDSVVLCMCACSK